MTRIYILVVLLIVLMSLTSCKRGSNVGTLYITDETHEGADLFTVKILEHSCNQSLEKNIFSEYKEKIYYGGYTWYVYDIPCGSKDIYLEYYEDGEYRNEREGIYILGDSSRNKWAAIWLVDNYGYSVWTEQGNGNLDISGSLFN